MIFTSDEQLAHLAEGDVVVLQRPVAGDASPSVASDGFTLDDLAVADVACGSALRPGDAWRCAGVRRMARHGASALDTEVVVRLVVPRDADVDATALLNAAMMRLALALAG